MKTSISVPVLIFSLISIISSAQEIQKEYKFTNLFEYGDSVSQSEDNLKNLFNNFSLLIENGEEVEFLSYEFVGVIKDQKDARRYLKKNFKDLYPFGWITVFHEGDTGEEQGTSTSSIRFVEDNQPFKESEKRRMINTISQEYIQRGDEVFAIDYLIDLQKYRHYVFINPNTKKVLLEGNIFGIKIPMSHIEHITNGSLSQSSQHAKNGISQEVPSNWQKQIQFLMTMPNKETKGDLQYLRLLSYRHIGVIRTEKDKGETIDSLLSNEAPFVVHFPPLVETDTTIRGDSCVILKKTFPKFEIISIEELAELPEINGAEQIKMMRQQLSQMIQLGFECLELKWSYKEKTFKSLCIVSDKDGGVVYEPVGGYILTGEGREVSS